MKLASIFVLTAAIVTGAVTQVPAQTRSTTLTLDFKKNLGPVEMDHISLGQGGLSPYPMWDERIAEIRALHPHLIRLFVQEYFHLLSADGQYHFETLDQSVAEIVQAGAQPLMSITIKPEPLFPKVNQDVVDPNDYARWEALISHLVNHYRQRGLHGLYWEVGNEGDIGELGGSPYRFTSESYVRYYRHTVAAILKADPEARVGGPAVSNYQSPILPALIAFCDRANVPLNFISWHTYDSDPKAIQATIEYVNGLLAEHRSLHPETILDEWNMALTTPPKDPRIQPAFVAETAWRMKESKLTYSCYYQIRDYHVDRDNFTPFFSPEGASLMANWWNREPQYSGLFDYQNIMRPAYFAFKLLARVTGARLEVTSGDENVHAFLSYDKSYGSYSLMFWNFSATPVSIKLESHGLPETLNAHRRALDAEAASGDENIRLRPLDDVTLAPSSQPTEIHLEPYGIEFWSLKPLRSAAPNMAQDPGHLTLK